MAWQRIIGLALATNIVLAGCESSPPVLARNQFLQDNELMTAISRNGGQPTDNIRGQKPDARPLSSLLEVPPDRPADAANGQPTVKICAVINDQAILEEEVRAIAFRELYQASALPEPERSRRTAEVFNTVLTRIIDREVVLQDAFDRLMKNDKGGARYLNKLKEAAKDYVDKQILRGIKTANHLKTDEELRRYLAEQGISLANFRRQSERNFMEYEYLRNRVMTQVDSQVNHKEIVEYYEKHPEEFQVVDSVQWQDLFVAAANPKYATRAEARAAAEALAEQARKGSDFANLVKQHDDGDSSLRNGDGVGSKRGEIRPLEAETMLFSLTDGQVGAVIELPTGFHVVKLIHRQKAGQLPFEEKVQKQIRDKLRNEVAARESKKIVQELKRKAVIVYAHNPK
jgi:peptidyl-prolyl cis-trans isomerase SurA